MIFETLRKNIVCIIKIVSKVKANEICLLLTSAKTGFAISEIIQIVKEIFKIATKKTPIKSINQKLTLPKTHKNTM